ncbi:MAG: PhoPQ-activated pathogenicity-related family protein, partial [Bryobacteraceae bacterium]
SSGVIRVKALDKPAEVKLWQATNSEKRDFRFSASGPKYVSSVLTEESAGSYVTRIAKPEKGWTAAFMELTYPGVGAAPLKVSSGVLVYPDVYPFPAPKTKPPI